MHGVIRGYLPSRWDNAKHQPGPTSTSAQRPLNKPPCPRMSKHFCQNLDMTPKPALHRSPACMPKPGVLKKSETVHPMISHPWEQWADMHLLLVPDVADIGVGSTSCTIAMTPPSAHPMTEGTTSCKELPRSRN